MLFLDLKMKQTRKVLALTLESKSEENPSTPEPLAA